MPILLVRHGKAGDRRKWEGPDRLRPLSKKGRKQAEALVDLLAGLGVERVLSSPFVRCVQTVKPLAERLGFPVEETDALAEEAGRKAVDLVRSLASATAVLCSHGDVVPDVLDVLAEEDGLRLPDEYPCAKGATWALEADADGRFVVARYLPPPSS